MWREIRRNTWRHLSQGDWSALRVERLRRKRCGAGEHLSNRQIFAISDKLRISLSRSTRGPE